MTDEEELQKFLVERDALFRNPTEEAAREWWHKNGYPPPVSPSVPLASVHKGRLQWLDATDDMLCESRDWLIDHGYNVTMKGALPLTPHQRDADRALLGKKPPGEE
jgi:hypothetical protein